VAAVLGADPALAPLLHARPGLRVPASLDPWEGLLAAMAAQRISLAAAAALLNRLAQGLAPPADAAAGTTAVLLPSADAVAAAGPERLHRLGMPTARANGLHAVAEAVVSGAVPLGPDADPGELRAALLKLPGIGPWTAEVAAMRALGDPDAFPATDLVLRRAAAAAGLDPVTLGQRATAWRPWRSYAAAYLWRCLGSPSGPATRRTGATAAAAGPPSTVAEPYPTKELSA
jgi:AraC family transcriptional regulator, regulatory protein of adaptative response / DNA-3-methyladenine glycosylase II